MTNTFEDVQSGDLVRVRQRKPSGAWTDWRYYEINISPRNYYLSLPYSIGDGHSGVWTERDEEGSFTTLNGKIIQIKE